MNNFAQMLPEPNQMDRPQLSDEELMRLAQMLQKQGEGLASINPSEAQMLQRAGGSGRPIPGTQGYGVGGGPIRSYSEEGSFEDSDTTDDEIRTLIESTGYTFVDQDGDKDPLKQRTSPDGKVHTSEAAAISWLSHPTYKKWVEDEKAKKAVTSTSMVSVPGPMSYLQKGPMSYSQPGGDKHDANTMFGKSEDDFYQEQEEVPALSPKSDELTNLMTGVGPESVKRDTGYKQNESTLVNGVQVTKVYANDGTGNFTIISSTGDANLEQTVKNTMDHSTNLENQGETLGNDTKIKEITTKVSDGTTATTTPTTTTPEPEDPETKRNAQKTKAADAVETTALTATGDYSFDRWYLANQTDYPDLSREELEKIFNTGMVEVRYESEGQEVELENWITSKFGDNTFVSGGTRKVAEDGSVVDVTPTTYETFKTQLLADLPNSFNRLSEQQIRGLYKKAMDSATREERFTLTTADIQRFDRPAPTMEGVSDVTAPQITEIPTATAPGVDTVDEATETVISFTPEVESTYLTNLRKDENELIDLLQKRIAGEAPSPAELQHKRQTEENLKMLFGTTRGGPADPARVRQVQNLWRDIQQVATGQAAEMRSAEQIAAEDTLAETLKAKGTREASLALGKMEAKKDVAIRNGDMESARKISVMQAKLTRSVAKAKIETDVVMANLEAKKQILIQNNQADLATVLANLQKDIIISETNAELSLQSSSLDDALALGAFQGETALAGLEVEIDFEVKNADLKAELTKLGIDSQEKMNRLDNETRIAVQKMEDAMRRAGNNQSQINAIIGAVALVLAEGSILSSDRRAKKKIKSGKSEAQQFLDSLKAYSYEYKDPDSVGAKAGRILSVMAQDLEKTDLGQQMVIDTPAGKFVDYGQSLAAILASQAHLNDELKSISARIT